MIDLVEKFRVPSPSRNDIASGCTSEDELSRFIADSDDVIPWDLGGQMRNEATDAIHKVIEGLSAR